MAKQSPDAPTGDLTKDPRVLEAAKKHNAKVLAANETAKGVIKVRLDNGLVITLQPGEQVVRQAQVQTPPTSAKITSSDKPKP